MHCKNCKGVGHDSWYKTCPHCHGSGECECPDCLGIPVVVVPQKVLFFEEYKDIVLKYGLHVSHNIFDETVICGYELEDMQGQLSKLEKHVRETTKETSK